LEDRQVCGGFYKVFDVTGGKRGGQVLLDFGQITQRRAHYPGDGIRGAGFVKGDTWIVLGKGKKALQIKSDAQIAIELKIPVTLVLRGQLSSDTG
jgi:hypothetical protein